MSDEPRENKRLIDMVERSYDKCLFSGDKGMWTVFEIVKRPIFQAPSELAADHLIYRLSKAGGSGNE